MIFFPGLASWYVFFRERDPDFKQSYVTLSEPDSGKQTEGELTLVDKLKVWHDTPMTRNVLCLDIRVLFFLPLLPFFNRPEIGRSLSFTAAKLERRKISRLAWQKRPQSMAFPVSSLDMRKPCSERIVDRTKCAHLHLTLS